MNKILQLIIQFTFLVLFIILTLIGKVHLWMGLFAMGVIASIGLVVSIAAGFVQSTRRWVLSPL